MKKKGGILREKSFVAKNSKQNSPDLLHGRPRFSLHFKTNPSRRKKESRLSDVSAGLTMNSRSTSEPYSTAPTVNRKIQKL